MDLGGDETYIMDTIVDTQMQKVGIGLKNDKTISEVMIGHNDGYTCFPSSNF